MSPSHDYDFTGISSTEVLGWGLALLFHRTCHRRTGLKPRSVLISPLFQRPALRLQVAGAVTHSRVGNSWSRVASEKTKEFTSQPQRRELRLSRAQTADGFSRRISKASRAYSLGVIFNLSLTGWKPPWGPVWG